ncbi:MAG: DNA repair protein RecN [Bradymonadia bacterium]|jgi:DNA repair protein RecN (Recombination protein N)
MLSSLTIRDFAIIDRVTLELGPGLTVITGETGAGKSILINALNLVLGGRATTEVVRTGAESATVEAVFDPGEAPELRARLAEAGVEAEGPLIVRRVLARNGRHRIFLNDVPVTLSTLAQVTAGLVDISGQHEHYSLLRTEFHLDLLDRMAGHGALRAEVAAAHAAQADVEARLEALLTAQRQKGERLEVLRFQQSELEAAGLKDPNEEDTLDAERRLLRNAEKLRVASQQAESALYADDGAAVERLSRAARSIRELAEVDPTLAPVAQDLDAAAALAEEAARTLGAYARRVHADPERLEQVESRLALLSKLRRKYGATLAEVLARRDALRDELSTLEHADEAIDALEKGRAKAASETAKRARKLTKARRDAGEKLGSSIQGELADLGMGRAVIQVRIEPLSRGAGLEADDLVVSARGADKVELLLSANPGEPPQSLARIASGGELSRFMLAVKRVIAERDSVGTYVFDEVDTGVGGPTAEAIGRKLRAVSGQRQALCITHLPQIAAMGDAHLHVEKRIEGDRTYSEVVTLEANDRVEELARMVGGATVTETTRALAREMLARR